MIGLIGRKIGMTRIYNEKGVAIPVTIVEVGPCTVYNIKTEKKDGYRSIQLGFGSKKPFRANLPEIGHVLNCYGLKPEPDKKININYINDLFLEGKITIPKLLKEFRVENESEFKLGQVLRVEDVFNINDRVKVTGFSKGRGFTGVVKRHGHSGGPKSHGSMFGRIPGSMGATTKPGRTYKNRALPGRHVNKRVSIRNLVVQQVFPEKNLLLLKGSIPGHINSIVFVEKIQILNKQKVGLI